MPSLRPAKLLLSHSALLWTRCTAPGCCSVLYASLKVWQKQKFTCMAASNDVVASDHHRIIALEGQQARVPLSQLGMLLLKLFPRNRENVLCAPQDSLQVQRTCVCFNLKIDHAAETMHMHCVQLERAGKQGTLLCKLGMLLCRMPGCQLRQQARVQTCSLCSRRS